jgi:hypothetical protein
VLAAAEQSGQASVLPQRIEFTQSLTVKADAVPAGETVRAWIPYPREIPGQQEQVQWLGSAPGKARVAPASTLQRTAYLEAKAVAGKPTRFEIRYAVTIFARHTAIDPAKVQTDTGRSGVEALPGRAAAACALHPGAEAVLRPGAAGRNAPV